VGSGEVLLFVGHGGAGGFRGLTETMFDTIPETGGLSTHQHRITSTTLFDLERSAEKKGDVWTWKALPSGVVQTQDTFPDGEKLTWAGHKWDKLGELGDALKSSVDEDC
jgi:hypothetical protein